MKPTINLPLATGHSMKKAWQAENDAREQREAAARQAAHDQRLEDRARRLIRLEEIRQRIASAAAK